MELSASDILCIAVNGVIVLVAIIHQIIWIKQDAKIALFCDLLFVGMVLFLAAVKGLQPHIQFFLSTDAETAGLISIFIYLAYLAAWFFYYRRFKDELFE